MGPTPRIFLGMVLGIVFLPGWWEFTTVCINISTFDSLCSPSKVWNWTGLWRMLDVQHRRNPSIHYLWQEMQPPRFLICKSRVELDQKGIYRHVHLLLYRVHLFVIFPWDVVHRGVGLCLPTNPGRLPQERSYYGGQYYTALSCPSLCGIVVHIGINVLQWILQGT